MPKTRRKKTADGPEIPRDWRRFNILLADGKPVHVLVCARWARAYVRSWNSLNPRHRAHAVEVPREDVARLAMVGTF